MASPPRTSPSSFVLITTPQECASVCFYLRSCRSLIVDCEGVNLGRHGRVCLIQITSPRATYIFDLIAGGPAMFTRGELGALLECRHSKPQRRASSTTNKQTTQQLPFPVLVMHDCRQDSDNLFAEYGVRIKNVFDTQVAHSVLRRFQNVDSSYPIGLNALLQTYIGKHNTHKDMIRTEMGKNSTFWAVRPLQNQYLDYAAQDVAYLYEAFTKMLAPLKQHDLISTVMFESQQYVQQYRDHIEGASFFQRQWKEKISMKQPYTAEQHFGMRSIPTTPPSLTRNSVSHSDLSIHSNSSSVDHSPLSSAATSPSSMSLSRSDSFSSQTSDTMSTISLPSSAALLNTSHSASTLPIALAPSIIPHQYHQHQQKKSHHHRNSLPISLQRHTRTPYPPMISPIFEKSSSSEFSYFSGFFPLYPAMKLQF